jgi:hypothetical protein
MPLVISYWPPPRAVIVMAPCDFLVGVREGHRLNLDDEGAGCAANLVLQPDRHRARHGQVVLERTTPKGRDLGVQGRGERRDHVGAVHGHGRRADIRDLHVVGNREGALEGVAVDDPVDVVADLGAARVIDPADR